MMNLRKVTSVVAIATFGMVPEVAATTPMAAADPAVHQVVYTVVAASDLTVDIKYMNTDPPH
ncbi:hypothetical protein [Mycobacterium lepromatosis]|uniref:hypothetical protein n=2 Tax=Mycobacterium lepromatosis TaxID=480418 RepID=UPI0012E05836|nr:hypothetical protein [Mycobacterium lepromatosis]